MGLAKRIIPCLDCENGRVVKGVKFLDIRDAGDPVEISKRYCDAGADEITFLDITASYEGRETTVHTVEAIASQVFIPLTVGGGIRTLEDIRTMLNAGADKVAINTAAVTNPDFVREAAQRFGSQCIVVAVDAKQVSGEGEPLKWEIFTHGGRNATGIDALEWIKRMVEYGAGEILLTSMDRDGTKTGFDLALNRAVSRAVQVPIIASGGVGNLQHLVDGIIEGEADAVLAASIFHFQEFTIGEAKQFMAQQGIEVRLWFGVLIWGMSSGGAMLRQENISINSFTKRKLVSENIPLPCLALTREHLWFGVLLVGMSSGGAMLRQENIFINSFTKRKLVSENIPLPRLALT